MKAPISSSSSQHSTLSNPLRDIKQLCRLYVFTGKGGVGKTSASMAFTKLLQSQKQKVLYHSFDQPLNKSLAQELKLPYFELNSKQSAEEYIADKLGSKTIAHWILKTPFFSSLLDMLPGLSQLILLGHIINKLESDPDLTIVLDSPSSGHAMTLFEASHNFKEIFKTGLIVQDIERMHQFIYGQNRLKTIILALPSAMAVQEGKELSLKLTKLNIPSLHLALNDVTAENQAIKDIGKAPLPNFLERKIELERQAINQLCPENKSVIFPHYNSLEQASIIRQMMPLTEGFQ